jgi:hypothetical protein
LRKKRARDSLTRSKHIHAQVKELEQNGEVENYFRLSIALGISDVHAKDLENLDKLREKLKIDERLNQKPFVEELRQCAQKLVRLRQERSQTTRWEPFATGSQYKCPDGDLCPTGKSQITYETRTDLLDHLICDHQINPPDAIHKHEVHDTLDRGRVSGHPALS